LQHDAAAQQATDAKQAALNKGRALSSIPMTGPMPHHQKDVYGNLTPLAESESSSQQQPSSGEAHSSNQKVAL